MAPASGRIGQGSERVRIAAAIALATLLLAWPAFYNGYPLVYDDSASYLDTINPRLASWARPVFYTLFLRPFHMQHWLWPAVFAQSLVLAHLLHVVVRTLSDGFSPRVYLLTVTALALTMLPWLSSMIMPHAFTGVVVLGLFLLGFAADRLGRLEKWYIALLTAGAITVHMSHLGLAAGLMIVILALRAYLRRRPLGFARGALLAFPVAAALLAQLAVNSYARGTVALAPAGSIFLLARLVADGPAVAYLRETCPQRTFILCAYVDEMPSSSDVFLWPQDGVFRRAGGASALQGEAHEIVLGTLRTHWREQLATTAYNVLRQLFALKIDSIIQAAHPTSIPDYPIRIYIETMFPRGYDAYLASRQSTGELPLQGLDALHAAVTVVSMAGCLYVMLAFRRRGNMLMAALPVVILAAWLGNAIITASVSGVFGHYQGRLAWLFTLYAAAGALRLQRGTMPLRRPRLARVGPPSHTLGG